MHSNRTAPRPFYCVINFLLIVFIGPLAFGLSAHGQTPRKNVLLICVDDLRPELNSFGASYIHSPNIDALARSGRAFHRHYVNSPSCGSSRYTLLTGRYGSGGNNDIFQRSAQIKSDPDSVPPSMPAWFKDSGYTTVSIGKVSHHPGGFGGSDWDDKAKLEMPNSWDRSLMPTGDWMHPRGAMHGLANGQIRGSGPKVKMPVLQSEPGPDEIYPDGLITNETINQIEKLAASDKPFFLAVGIIRPHLPFGAPAKYMEHYRNVELPPIAHPNKPEGKTTWHRSGEFMKYSREDNKDPREDAQYADTVRRHYAACVSFADAQVGRIIQSLNDAKVADDTIIVLWGDHGWHLGEHNVWGKHTLFEESLLAPLVIVTPEMKLPGEKTDAMVSTVDIFPTLCELAELKSPDFAVGRSLVPQLADPTAKGHDVVAYLGDNTTLRTADKRLIVHDDGFVELYDYAGVGETKNVASDNGEVVKQLETELSTILGSRRKE